MVYDRLVMLDDCSEGDCFTFKAGRVISGGFLVGFSSGTDIVTSGGNFGGYAWDDVLVDAGSVGSANFMGIALQTVATGKPVAVKMNGIFVLAAGSAGVTGGYGVQVAAMQGYQAVENGLAGSQYHMLIGRALSTGTAQTGFAIVRLY